VRTIAGVVLATLASIGAEITSANGEPRPRQERLTLGLHVKDTTGTSEHLVELAVNEARALWMQHGVVLSTTSAADACVMITIQNGPLSGTPRTAWESPLGAIEFVGDILPKADIHVSLGSIDEVIHATGSLVHLYDESPRMVHDQMLARAIGRVVAHEIGHFVLQFPAHVRHGIMAARHTSSEFTDANRRKFELTPLLDTRLKAVLDGGIVLCRGF